MGSRSIGWLLVVLGPGLSCSAPAPVFRTTAGDDTVVAKGTRYRWTFDEVAAVPGTGEIAAPPERTFVGVLGRWDVARDDDAPSPPRVYRQDERYGADDAPRVLVSSLFFRDLSLRVLCRADGGSVAEGCGLVFDARGSDDYFVARAEAIGRVVRLVHVSGGQEREVAAAPLVVTSHVWHAMGVRAKGEHVRVEWDGAPVLDAVDWSRTGGKIGLATIADETTSFDDLEVVAE